MTTATRAAPSRAVPTWVWSVAVTVVLVVIMGGIAYVAGSHLLDLWRHRNDIAVDWDPGPPANRPYEPYNGRPRTDSPSGTRFALRSQGRMIVVHDPSQEVLADLGSVDEVTWVSDDRLVAFGFGTFGDFEGVAVVDLADRSVDQVDTHGHADKGLQALAVTDDGQVEVCQWIPDPDPDGSGDRGSCGPHRFLIDPTTADLRPA